MPMETFATTQPMLFAVNQHNNLPVQDITFKETLAVDYRAKVSRVNKEFATVAA